MSKPPKIRDAVYLRVMKYNKYETDFYFNKTKEVFFATVPPAVRIEASSVEELTRAVRAHHETYVVPGQWVRKIYVSVSGDQGEAGGSLFYGCQNYGQSRSLDVAFALFEERDGGCPPGTRMARVWDPDPDPRWEDSRDRIYGQDIKSTLEGERGEEGRETTVLEWTQEREDALRDIQKAMAQLQARLGDLIKRPELTGGALGRALTLGPGLG